MYFASIVPVHVTTIQSFPSRSSHLDLCCTTEGTPNDQTRRASANQYINIGVATLAFFLATRLPYVRIRVARVGDRVEKLGIHAYEMMRLEHLEGIVVKLGSNAQTKGSTIIISERNCSNVA